MAAKKPMINPYMPSWEYVPDGEPHVFNGRVYVYGSHDQFNGWVYCQNDYICYSAPEDDLSDWRYEGVIYKKTQDPFNPDGRMCLYAPDITVGPDGRYYLYYVLDKVDVVSCAVCDSPAGQFEFYGYVRHADGSLLGNREGDDPQFDPAVITEGDKTYLYTGFCSPWDHVRRGPMCTVLGPDMLTIVEETVFIGPTKHTSEGTGWEGHEFFEGPSIRKFNDKYYFVFSSVNMHELCYAISDRPNGGFKYMGTIVSNNDSFIDTYKPADKTMYWGGNNHGGLVKAGDDMYIFYHRHTNSSSFCRQGCIEKVYMREDGSIPQVEMTSCCGGEPLPGKGEYPTYIACHIIVDEDPNRAMRRPPWAEKRNPRITQDGRDDDHELGYVAEIEDGTTVGFKYFKFEGVKKITVYTRGYAQGVFEVRTKWDGEVLGTIPVYFGDIWLPHTGDVNIPDGVSALYFTFKGRGPAQFGKFVIE